MLKEQLEGLKVSLVDEELIEDMAFIGDNVAATIGTRNGAVSAPTLSLEIIDLTSLLVSDTSINIEWSDINISGSQINVLRNGKPAIYKITSQIQARHQKRGLP